MKKEKLVLNEEIIKIKSMMKKINENRYFDDKGEFLGGPSPESEESYDEENRLENFIGEVENNLQSSAENALELAKEDFPDITVDEILSKSKEMLQLFIEDKLNTPLLRKYYEDDRVGKFADEIVECALYLSPEYMQSISGK